MKDILKQRFLDSWLVCLFTTATFFLIGPITLYIGNQDEFVFYLKDILPQLAGCTVAAFFVLLAICMVIENKKIRTVFTAIILGIGIGFFVQANFMSSGYGTLNGEIIDWASMNVKGMINSTIWLICIAVPVFAALRIKGNISFFLNLTAVGMIIVQILACGILVFTVGLGSKNENTDFTITTEEAFTLDDEQNVVIFLLDSFSSNIFAELLNENSDYQNDFNGFTYFANSSGIGTTTKGSLPYILTGIWNENAYTYNEYLNMAYKNSTLYPILKKLNYDSRLFVSHLFVGNSAVDLIDNINYEKTLINKPRVTELMYKLTAFTYMPHYLKQPFWFYTGAFKDAIIPNSEDAIVLSPDPAFYSSLQKHGLNIDNRYKGAYRFYYLQGAHSPNDMNEQSEAVEVGSVSTKQRAQGALNIVTTYLQQLKDLGIYDNTMVIVLADHGQWDDTVFNPLLIVKPFSTKTDGVSISNAPISYEDLMPTLIEALTDKDAGNTFFEIEESENRTRRFLYYDWDGNWSADYLPSLHEFNIIGNVYNPLARIETGRIYTSEGIIDSPQTYRLGQIVEYTLERANETKFVLDGMHAPEQNHTWTKNYYTHWFFPIESYNGGDLTFKLNLVASLNNQRALLYVNDAFVSEKVISSGGTVIFEIPKAFIDRPEISIRLEFPDASQVNPDSRVIGIAIRSVVLNTPDGEEFFPTNEKVLIPHNTEIPVQPTKSFSITELIGIPLAALLKICYDLMGHYSLAIVLFTLLTKVILFPISIWTQKNGITMVRMTPELNRIKIKYYGDKDSIADETQALYKRENYHALASTVPMIIQLVMLMGVIGAVKIFMGDAQTILNSIPSEAGGWTYITPVAAGFAALALGLAQNKLNPLQREQSPKEQWMTNGISIAISLVLGAFVSMGVCVYWIASNLFSILQQVALNIVVNPKKYIDYEELECSKKELASMENIGEKVSAEDKKREKDDYKKFFSVANKHLVFYSEKSGFYKYFKDVIDYLLVRSNVIIHYVTSDPKDQIFEISKTQPRIRPYYIGENRLITLMMKMDADIVVMTVPDLDNFHLKRSYVRKDIEYIYMFHYPLSTHMVLRTGALDHYDTIFCVGDFQFDEIRAAERVYNLPEKKLLSAGYGQLEQLHNSYQSMKIESRQRPKILLAPSWQPDNILDSCVDEVLEQLLGKGYEVVVRPHPEYMKRFRPRMDQIVERYKHRIGDELKFELDFTSNNSLFDSDILITDWSGSAYEFSFVTLKPSVFIDTTPKINNPEYVKLGVEPLEFALRSQVGIQISPSNLNGLNLKINELLANGKQYAEKILQIRETYISHFGESGKVGGQYIIDQMIKRQNQRKHNLK